MRRPRQQPLVCQHLENLSSAALESHEDIIRSMVGRRHGIYALFKKNRLYYVGLATNLRTRLKAHLKDRHKGLWDRFSVYLTIENGHLKELESLVLRIAAPKGNRQNGKFAKSENMTADLRRRVKRKHRAEWIGMIGGEPELPAKRPARRPVRGKPRLAGLVERTVPLRAKYKGKIITARITPSGAIKVNKRRFNSPSLAAFAVVKKPINGWRFWQYQRAPGQWVLLDEMRKN